MEFDSTMARRVITQTVFEDDLTGAELSEEEITTQRFTIDGTQYEIDLGPESLAAFTTAMDPWTKAARRVGGKKSSTAAKKSTAAPARTNNQHSAAEIRDWARTNGIDVTERGRVPDNVREQFEQAHQLQTAS